jgi:ubiquinone/menaquinone biosynthesis C-methylase UbiE
VTPDPERFDVVERGRFVYVPRDEYVYGPRSEFLLVRKNRYRISLLPGQEKLSRQGIGWLTEDNSPEGYDELWGSDEAVAQFLSEADGARIRLREEIVDHILPFVQKHARVIDIGCGAGDLLIALRQFRPGISVTGLDFSAKAIERARRNLPDGDFVMQHISDLPYPSEGFDIVLCTDTLEHMEQPRQLVGELVRICTAGGSVIIVVPDGDVDDFLGHRWFWNEVSLTKLLSPWSATVQRLPQTREFMAVIKRKLAG